MVKSFANRYVLRTNWTETSTTLKVIKKKDVSAENEERYAAPDRPTQHLNQLVLMA